MERVKNMHMQSIQESHPRLFRQALGQFATGVTVITTMHEGIVHGMTANAFCSVSLEPPLVLVSVDTRSHMHRLLTQSRRYGVSVLSKDQEELSRHFAGRSQEGLRVPFTWHDGYPLIEGAVAHLTCQVIDVHPAGDHTLFIGRVEHLGYADNCAPLLFYGGKYHRLEVQIRDYVLLNDVSWW
jgi:flavin reductase (DIM6/NTAB) family NADH-FMN oxidoreductase RutF